MNTPSKKNKPVTQYSNIFTTVYEEKAAPGTWGYGYSILRARDNSSNNNAVFDFAIIWDGDHDTRIIETLEELYKNNLLHYFIFVGERKGVFTGILNPKNEKRLADIFQALPKWVNADGDTWNTNFLSLDNVGNGYLIPGNEQEIKKNINLILERWGLGKKIINLEPTPTPIPKSVKASASAATVDEDELSKKFSKSLQISAPDKTDSYKDTVVKMVSEREKRKVSMYGFPNKEAAQSKEFLWQKKTVAKFFRVGKPLIEGKQSHTIHKNIKKYLATEAAKRKPMNLENYCRRSLIIALSKILTEYQSMPALAFKLGPTIIKLSPSDAAGTRRQKGNFKMEIDNADFYDIAYGEGCVKRLIYFAQPKWDLSSHKERRQKLLNLIKERLPIIKPFKYSELNKYGNVMLGSDKEYADPADKRTLQNLHFLNGLIFLITTVEVLVRLYRDPNGNLFPYTSQNAVESDAFPVAIAQARSLLLLLNGKITFNDFIGQSKREGYDDEQHRAYYGAVTGTGTIDNIEMMLNKLFAINKLNNSIVANAKTWEPFCKSYLDQNKAGYLTEGRSRMYFDLTYAYGSGGESDEETPVDYSSEDDTLDFVNFTP